jgi:hypothetical protein
MTQSFADKCAAIESLLESVFAHLDYVPGAMRVQRYGDAELEGGSGIAQQTCIIRRWTCWGSWPQYRLIVQLPPKMSEEKWAREYADLRRRYRIADLEASLIRLSDAEPSQAQAVWAVHVEPWLDPATEPIGPVAKETRRLLAVAGVEWMAHDIRGDVLAFGEKREPIDNEICRMLADNWTERRIAHDLGVGRDRIRALKRTLEVRCE